MNGQLLETERKTLYNQILLNKPNLVFETGTWYGGGSTYFIANALRHNNNGRLITCEINPDFYNSAVKSYTNHELDKYITFMFRPSNDIIDSFMAFDISPDFVFYDGCEDPDVVLDDFKKLERIMKPGSVFSIHDWFNDGSRRKLHLQHYIKPSKWNNYLTLYPPDSVGLNFFKMK